MARWNPRRWSLGAPVLVALLIAGCGSSSQPRASLHPSAEKRLLSLVARARVDASAREGTAASAVLGEFVSEVNALKKSGQLRSTTAARLERAARATASAASRLHPKAAHPAATAGAAVSGSQTSTAADPATITAPASTTTAPTSGSTPSQISSSDANPAQPGTNPALPADAKQQKQKSCGSPWSGHHHHGKGLGHGGFGNPKCKDGTSGWSRGGNNWQGGGGD